MSQGGNPQRGGGNQNVSRAWPVHGPCGMAHNPARACYLPCRHCNQPHDWSIRPCPVFSFGQAPVVNHNYYAMRTFQTYNAPPPFGYQPANFYAPTPQPPQVSYYPGFNSPMAFGAAPQAAVMAPPTSAWPAPQSRGQQNARGKGKGKGGKRGTEGGKGETSTAPVQSAGVKKSKKQRKREAFDEYKAKKRAEQKERVGAMIARFQERGVPLPPGITLAPGTDGGGNTPAAVGQETSANTQAQDRTGQLTIEGPPPAADGATTESGVSSVREITEDEELAYLASIGPE